MASGGKKGIDNEIKLEVRAVLLSKIGGILLNNFQRDFMNLLDHPIKYRDVYGFNTLEELLRAMPDVVRFVYSDCNQDWRMFGVGDKRSYMSEHAKKALGKPGEDVDKFEGKKPKRSGRHVQNRRQRRSFQPQTKRSDRNSSNQVSPNLQQTTGIAAHLKGLYPICCPLMGKSEMEILAEFKTVANVVAFNLSNCYLFAWFSSPEDAMKVLNTFKTKYCARLVENRGTKSNTEKSEKSNTNRSTISNGVGGPPSGQVIEIYIGNIPEGIDEAVLRHLLGSIAIINVRIKQQENKRFAFASFYCLVDALLAVETLSNKIVKGRRIICRLARPNSGKDGKGTEICRVDMECLMKLVGIGFPLEGSRRALHHSGADIPAAIAWIRQHQDDPDFNTPVITSLSKAKPDSNTKSFNSTVEVSSPVDEASTADGFIPDVDALKQFTFIGVPREQALAALKAANNDLQDASEWLIKITEELLSLEKAHMESLQKTNLKEEKEQSEFIPDQQCLQDLIEGGIDKDLAYQALETTNNDLDEAALWLFENSPEIRTILEEKNFNIDEFVGETEKTESPNTQPDFIPNESCLSNLVAGGINKDTAYQALKTANNDLDQAAVWLLKNSPQLQSIMNEKKVNIQELLRTAEIQSGDAVDSITQGVLSVNMEDGEGPQRILNSQAVSNVSVAGSPDTQPRFDVKKSAEQVNGNHSAITLDCNYDDIPPLEIDDEPPELEYYDYDDDQSTDSQSLNTSESSRLNVPVYVGRFPSGTKQLDLLELFSEYRPVKIKMINNDGSFRKTFAFVVLGDGEMAERAIEEMNGAMFGEFMLQVGRAFLDKGYDEPEDDSVNESLLEGDPEEELTSVPQTVSFYHTLLEQVWPYAKILNTDLFGVLPIDVTCVVDDHYFFGHVLKFRQEANLLEAINAELNTICSVHGPDRRIPEHRCCAKYEGSWYRAYNMGSLGSGNTQAVMFLDYGNIEQLPPSDLRRPILDMFEDSPVIKAFELVGSTVYDCGITVGRNVTLEVIRGSPHELASVTRVTVQGGASLQT